MAWSLVDRSSLCMHSIVPDESTVARNKHGPPSWWKSDGPLVGIEDNRVTASRGQAGEGGRCEGEHASTAVALIH